MYMGILQALKEHLFSKESPSWGALIFEETTNMSKNKKTTKKLKLFCFIPNQVIYRTTIPWPNRFSEKVLITINIFVSCT